MTVQSTINKQQFACNGSAQQFPFGFQIFNASDIIVVLTDPAGANSVLAYLIDYDVSAAPDGWLHGGTVQTSAVYPVNSKLTIVRKLDLVQTLDLGFNDRLPSAELEKALDRIVMILQDHEEALERTVKLSVTSNSDPENYLELAQNSAAAATSANDQAQTAKTAAELARDQAQAAAEVAGGGDVDAHNIDPEAHPNTFGVHNASPTAHSAIVPAVCQGRLTLSSGNPVADVASAQVLYLTPYNGNKILLSGGVRTLTEVSLDISALTANTNFDIYAYWNDAVILEAVAWTDNTTRATALATLNGVKVKSGETSKMYLGTIRTTATLGTCADSDTKRFVWNQYNRVTRDGCSYNTNDYWTYVGDSWRECNNSSGQIRFECVLGDVSPIQVDNNLMMVFSSASVYGQSTVALDGVNIAWKRILHYADHKYGKSIPILNAGYHYITAMERGDGASTITVYGGKEVSRIEIKGEF
ncbi:MAG: hypothetical protein JXR78_16630 [Victivallales bacterium]|nr:hypothetical protein [Victivallales bacterium]